VLIVIVYYFTNCAEVIRDVSSYNFQPDPQNCTTYNTNCHRTTFDHCSEDKSNLFLRVTPVESTFCYTIQYVGKAAACSICVTGGTLRGYADRSAEHKAGLINKPTLVRIRASPSRLGVVLSIIATGR
jgi:hypothetical protein